jgi:hypothetical protein
MNIVHEGSKVRLTNNL